MKVQLLLLVCVLGAAVLTVVVVARRRGDGPDGQDVTPQVQNQAASEHANDRRSDPVARKEPRTGVAVNENVEESQEDPEEGGPPPQLTRPQHASVQEELREDPGKGGAPPQSAESQQGSAREDGISLGRAVAIARQECKGVIQIPDDAIVETRREGGNIVTTFRKPRVGRRGKRQTTRPSWYAEIVVNAQTGEVVQRLKP